MVFKKKDIKKHCEDSSIGEYMNNSDGSRTLNNIDNHDKVGFQRTDVPHFEHYHGKFAQGREIGPSVTRIQHRIPCYTTIRDIALLALWGQTRF